MNTLIGQGAGYNTNRYYNTGVGYGVLSNTTGAGNIAIGHLGGGSVTTGTYNIFMGFNSGYSVASQKIDATNSIAIGYNTYTTASNQVVLGNSSITHTILRGSVGIGIETLPGQKLEVLGNIKFGNTTDGYGRLFLTQKTARTYPTVIMVGADDGSTNELNFGGGTSIGYITKKINFHTATDDTTTGNSIAMDITSTGTVHIVNKLGIGLPVTVTPTYILSLSGDAARVIWMERHTTSNTAGNTLTLQAGGCTAAATDKAGGTLYLKPGLSTGTGESGVQVQGCPAGSTGTTDGTPSTFIQVLGNKLGFFGVTPVIRQTELTDELTTITHTAPGTPDYALSDLTDTGGFGFATKDEGNSVLAVIANLQARVNELETKLTAYGLLQDAD
jgi:hypothetical protein